jgi:gamma-glutamylcyclotransferase (GGCT)/AIG2-like uncharacterized protein YtfP
VIHRLFVYGTLAPGRPNEHVLAEVPGTWEPASVAGHLYERGWGAASGFPGIVLDERAEPVEGLLFSSDDLDAHWDRLDAFEGEGYARALTTVRLPDGQTVKAFIYVLHERASS